MQSAISDVFSDAFLTKSESTFITALQWTCTAFVAFLLLPIILMTGYGLYYGIFYRPKEQAAMALSPLLTFLYFLTCGATSDSHQRLLQLFHRSLIEDVTDGGSVQRGLLLAMSRCLADKFGRVTNIPLGTAVLKREGNSVSCVAFVDFERAQQVRCQLSWRRRPAVVQHYRQQSAENVTPVPREAFQVSGIGIALPFTFEVTDFHVDPQRADAFDILPYVHLVDFDDVGVLFVRRLFRKPPTVAVSMMAESLAETYASATALNSLQETVQGIAGTCGGLEPSMDHPHVDQLSYKAIYTTADGAVSPTQSADSRGAAWAIGGVDMKFLVKGHTRNIEVDVQLTFSGLKALVNRYEVRALVNEDSQGTIDDGRICNDGAATVVDGGVVMNERSS